MSGDRLAAVPETELLARLAAHHEYLLDVVGASIGFPAATDIDCTVLAPFLRLLVNNLGDPEVDGRYPLHSKEFECEAWRFVADLLGLPADDRWGYVTSGATEGNEHGLHLARQMYPTGLVYASAAAHPSIGAVLDRLRMDHLVVRATASGEMDYDDLSTEICQHRDRPAIVVACIGAPLTEAVDDVTRISAVLDEQAVGRRWIHADAALSGLPLALLDDDRRPGFDFGAGTRSMILSMHKFLGTPTPAGVFLIRDSDRPYPDRAATYTGSPDSTWSNSRSGLAALCLWYVLHSLGVDGLRARADQSRDLAGYTHRQLVEIGWPAWRHNPYGFTVVIQTPPPAIAEKWHLPDHGGLSHLICMPGQTRDRIDMVIRDLRGAADPVTDPKPGPDRPANGDSVTALCRRLRSGRLTDKP